MGAKITFWQYLNQSCQFWVETRSVFVFPWFKSANLEILSNLPILDRIWAKEGPNMGLILGKITLFAISSQIMVILRWNSVSMCISMVYLIKLRDSFKLSYFGHNLGQRRSKYGPNFGKITFLAIASPISVILSWNSVTRFISMF